MGAVALPGVLGYATAALGSRPTLGIVITPLVVLVVVIAVVVVRRGRHRD
jgi:hypothetical protein